MLSIENWVVFGWGQSFTWSAREYIKQCNLAQFRLITFKEFNFMLILSLFESMNFSIYVCGWWSDMAPNILFMYSHKKLNEYIT